MYWTAVWGGGSLWQHEIHGSNNFISNLTAWHGCQIGLSKRRSEILPLARTLCTVVCSLTPDATIHSFITARLDHCCLLYTDHPVEGSGCLVSKHIHKFGHVSSYLLDVLCWFPLQQMISFLIIALVWLSLLGLGPVYLRDLCCIILGPLGRCSLCSLW